MSVGPDSGERRIWLPPHQHGETLIWLHPHHHRETLLGGHALLFYHKWKESLSLQKTLKKPPSYPQKPKHKCEGLFFFLAFPDFIAPEALDGILVTAVTPALKEMVARPTTVLCWALSVRGDIC